jgi:hypothetical protein
MELRGKHRQRIYDKYVINITTKSEKKKKACILIDVAIPADRNITQEGAEKKLKCKNLCTDIQGMWDLKCMNIPVMI